MITEEHFNICAKDIGCEVAAIKAVAAVESGGNGFLENGMPTILFEPHIFWKQLKLVGVDPKKLLELHPDFKDILYPVWGSLPYGNKMKQHERLTRAATSNREAALKSASWGKFQIMGFNYKLCGCDTLQSFINAIYKDENSHLSLFTNYIKSADLVDELLNLDWKGFARGYNGSSYAKNSYDTKLKNAYMKFR
jgi:N-acetylmuramidase